MRVSYSFLAMFADSDLRVVVDHNGYSSEQGHRCEARSYYSTSGYSKLLASLQPRSAAVRTACRIRP